MIRCCSSTVSAMPPREALGFKGADDSFHESFILGLADAGEEMGGGAGSEAFEELAVGFRCRDDSGVPGRLTAPSQARTACLEEIEEEIMMEVRFVKMSTVTKA